MSIIFTYSLWKFCTDDQGSANLGKTKRWNVIFFWFRGHNSGLTGKSPINLISVSNTDPKYVWTAFWLHMSACSEDFVKYCCIWLHQGPSITSDLSQTKITWSAFVSIHLRLIITLVIFVQFDPKQTFINCLLSYTYVKYQNNDSWSFQHCEPRAVTLVIVVYSSPVLSLAETLWLHMESPKVV